jgi:AcrR family transcriptional regulator
MTDTANEKTGQGRGAGVRPRRLGIDRGELLRVAAELFSQRGYQGVSLEEVAGRLGVKKASLYHYIDSKQMLLLEICERWVDAIEERMRPIADSTLAPDEKLRRMVHAYIDLAHQDVYFRTAVLWINDLEDDRLIVVLRRFRECERLFERVIVAGQKLNLFKPLEPRLAVLALFGMCDAVPIWGRYVKYPGEQIAAEFCMILESGIHADGKSHSGSWPRAHTVEEALAGVSERVRRLRREADELAGDVDRARQRLEEGLARE